MDDLRATSKTKTGTHEKATMNPLDIEAPTAEASRGAKPAATASPAASASGACGCCARLWHYGGITEARGYALLAMARGAAVMSNLVVNAALLELASAAAGCPTGEELRTMEATGAIESAAEYECTGTVYGQNPLSLISNIAVVTGVLNALFMPMIGVALDFTSYRKFTGILFSVIFTAIQAAQIGLGPRTWFAMAILQALAGVCYSVLILTAFAYLPEICERAGQRAHARYTARFTAKQFGTQASFLVLVGAASYGLGFSDDSVRTARLSQALNVGIVTLVFGCGWRCMPPRAATREIPPGTRGCGVIVHGLRQNVRTAVSIQRDYKKGLKRYLLATTFAQSSVAALTTVSVLYLSSEVGLNAVDISLFFLVVLASTLPGAKWSSVLSGRGVDPNASWQLAMLYLFGVMAVGALTLGGAANKYLSLIWGLCVGVALGWFYPTENLFFSCILPKGQEAEMAGFRVYCSMILSWLPPLIFSVLIGNGVDAKWGMIAMASFLLLAVVILRFGPGTWEEILRESGRTDPAESAAVEESPPSPLPRDGTAE